MFGATFMVKGRPWPALRCNPHSVVLTTSGCLGTELGQGTKRAVECHVWVSHDLTLLSWRSELARRREYLWKSGKPPDGFLALSAVTTLSRPKMLLNGHARFTVGDGHTRLAFQCDDLGMAEDFTHVIAILSRYGCWRGGSRAGVTVH